MSLWRGEFRIPTEEEARAFLEERRAELERVRAGGHAAGLLMGTMMDMAIAAQWRLRDVLTTDDRAPNNIR